ncbi:uncharacterized protein LOC107359623 [Tetranychus urticae]|uniref:Resistance to inhibitors of cholinesterase protein 3 N-terminal domain-containing protein n=1 Tax=Tetranychus urticae TaxID=32264 RepID=T1JRY0_TETUR|nr:uncharacterized protein LOC107359623 [Tetranychus urticae]
MISIKSTLILAVTIACLVSLSLAKPPTSTTSTPSSSPLTSGSSKSNVKVNGTSSTRARGSRSGFDPNYSMWGHATPSTLSSTGRFDMVPLIPIVLLFGLGLMLIPFLTSFIAHVLYPSNLPAGRKRRSTDSSSGFLNDMMINVLKNLESSIEKYTS